MNNTQVIAAIQTVVFGLIGSFLVGVIVKLYPKVDAFVVAHIGLANSEKLYSFGWKAWYIVEEYYRTSKPLISKIEYFEELMISKFPLITSTEINNARQAIAGQFNASKAKVIQELDPTAPAVPVISYFDPLTGLPLAPGVLPVMPV
jgi:hypothetical protein